MVAKDILVNFQNNRVVYAPGDVVQGTVTIDLKRPKKVKKIKVNAIGESVVKLKSSDGKQLRNTEKYFHYTIDLYTGGKTEIAAGKHPFPFQVQLPRSLPTSYEGSMGYVRYSILADIEYQGFLSGGRSKATSSFTVLDVVDLNTIPSARAVQQIQCEKAASGMLWWRKNAVTVHLATEKTGFVPGEYVHVNGLIVNGRSRPITNIRIELWQKVTFHGRVKNSAPNSEVLKHDVSNAVATWTMENSPIDAESAANWERKQLFQIPPLVSSGLRNCRIIDIQYFIKVSVVIPGSISSSILDAKSNYITIGTVPLMSPEQSQQPAIPTPQHVEATAPAMEDMPPELLGEFNAPPPYDPGNTAFSKVLLPSYQEAITGGASLSGPDNDDAASVVSSEAQENQFVPQYAFFDFNQTYQNTTAVSAVPSAPPDI